MPALTLSTDVIVGFCGETEAELEGTERLLRDVRFDVVHLQAYSPRPGTAAARREDDVPLEEKKRRLNHLLVLQRDIALARNLALRETEVEVLVEGTTEDGRPYGRTRGNRVTRLPESTAAAGDLVRAVVRSATAWQLVAEPPSAAGGARAS
ncbi:MAG: hypothetical protein E6J03_13540 [Chloroflexi bacterium]|nr:MAG: hypothetical protein E6J03_13540 [Chloroflexota bacterium]